MALHDVRDLKDIQKIRLTRPNQTNKVLVRLTMLIIAVKYGDQPSLDLTDFTSGYRSSVLTFTVKTGSLASQHFKELKKAYPIVDNSTRNVLSGTKNKVNFLENGYHVFLNVVAEAYNGVTEYQLKVTEFKIINKQPQMILRMSLTQQSKITSLVKLLERRRENNDMMMPKNEDEFQKIVSVLRRDDKNDQQSKKQKLNEAEISTQQTEPSQPSSNSIAFPSDPLFNPATDNQEDDIPFTQMQDEVLRGSDDFDSIALDNSSHETESQPQSTSNRAAQNSLPEIKEEPNKEVAVKPEPDTDMNFEPSGTNLSQKLRDNNIEVITVLNDSGNDTDDSEEDEIENSQDDTKDGTEPSKRHKSLTPIARDNVTLEPDQSEDEQLTQAHTKDHDEQNEKEDGDNIQDLNETEEQNYALQQDGIASIMRSTIELGVSYQFTGFVIGIEPSNFRVIAKPFDDLIKATNFKLYISNIPQTDSNVFKLNKNVICLEFRTKEQILSFFRYDDIESAFIDQDKIQEKLLKLLRTRDRIEVDILRKQINLSVGKQYIWETNKTIDKILGQEE